VVEPVDPLQGGVLDLVEALPGTVKDPGAHCTNQVYTVDGSLRNVPVTGTGHFVATLTHHRRSVLGRCLLYAATVGGTVTLP
jgi:hypothetical protein